MKQKDEKSPEMFTPLNCTPSYILSQIEGLGYLQNPTPILRAEDERYPSEFCRFHRSHGHPTDDCRALRRAIERLVREGRLGQYVASGHRPESSLQGELRDLELSHLVSNANEIAVGGNPNQYDWAQYNVPMSARRTTPLDFCNNYPGAAYYDPGFPNHGL